MSFFCQYFLGPLQGCGGLLRSTSGSFASLDADGNGYYEPELDCTWQIVAPQGQVISLTFNSFNLEVDQNCDYDYIEVMPSN